MKLRVLGAFGGEGPGQRASAFLVNDTVLVDAGTVAGALKVREQLEIEHAVISHPHLDHVAGLAFLAETFACVDPHRRVTITGLAPVVEAIRATVFNNVLWPDFAAIPQDSPVVKYRSLIEEAEQRVGDLWVTPVEVCHSVVSAGFIIHDGSSGFIYSGDTGPTEALWKAARGLRGLKAVIIECAFPTRMAELAAISGHMTPELLQRELPKLPPDVPVWVFHVKPQFYEETAEELSRVGDGRVTLIEQDRTYTL